MMRWHQGLVFSFVLYLLSRTHEDLDKCMRDYVCSSGPGIEVSSCALFCWLHLKQLVPLNLLLLPAKTAAMQLSVTELNSDSSSDRAAVHNGLLLHTFLACGGAKKDIKFDPVVSLLDLCS